MARRRNLTLAALALAALAACAGPAFAAENEVTNAAAAAAASTAAGDAAAAAASAKKIDAAAAAVESESAELDRADAALKASSAAAAVDPDNLLTRDEMDAMMRDAGFSLNAKTGLYDPPADIDKSQVSRQVLLPDSGADHAAFANVLLDQQHKFIKVEHGEFSLPAGVTFLVKEYQQLLADALAITGVTQPAVELDWLAQHVQYKIQEFNTLLAHISPSLANHVSIGNPIYTNKPYLAGGTSQSTNNNAWWRNGPQALDISVKGAAVGPNLINIRPCLINVGVTGATSSPRLLNLSPRLIQISTTGAYADPKLINIQPTLIKVKGTGIQLTPRQFNISPSLIEASPGITIKDDNLPVPKTERWGAPILDFSGKGVTVKAGDRMPAKKDLPTPPNIPKFNKNGLKYQG